eukprot:3059886-Ditylum_brightwellii.AAC.1
MLTRMNFIASQADPDLWIKREGNKYHYIATHVDDVFVASDQAAEYISQIEQEYAHLETSNPIQPTIWAQN